MFLRLPATPSASQGLPVSSRCSPDPIPSLTLHHFSLALSQGCCQYLALAPEQCLPAIAVHVPALWGGRGSPRGAWNRLCAILAWLELNPALCTGAIGVFWSVQCSPRHPSAAGIGQAWACWRQGRAPPSPGHADQMWPHLAGLLQLSYFATFIYFELQAVAMCALAVLF